MSCAVGVRACLMALMVFFLSGCFTNRYLPPAGQYAPQIAVPEALQGFEAQVTLGDMTGGSGLHDPSSYRLMKSQSEQDIESWFAQPGNDFVVNYDSTIVGTKGWLTLIPYFLTLSIVPTVTTSDGETTLTITAGDQELYRHTERYQMRSAISLFPTAYAVGPGGTTAAEQATVDQLSRHKLALGRYIAARQQEYEAAVSAHSVEGYRQFLKDNPDSLFRMETLRRLAEMAPSRNALAYHRENAELEPAYIVYLPDEYDIWFLGPEGFRVYEVLQQSRTESDTLLVSRIKAAAQPYKVFSSDEISLLKEGGLSDELIAAMIDVSASAPAAVAAPATAAATAAPAAAPTEAPPAEGAPTVGDIAAQCAKRYAAMKACDNVPSFGANICRNQVKRQYSHIACQLIE